MKPPIVTPSVNRFRGAIPLGKIPYHGVHLHKQTGKFCAQITIEYKKIHLGLFNTPEEAAEAYKRAVAEYR